MATTAPKGVTRTIRKRPLERKAGRQQPAQGASRAVTMGTSGLPLLRTSERGTFKRCHFKWWMEFHEQIKPDLDVPPLRFGTLIHQALAAYYKPGIRRGPNPADKFQELYRADLVDAAQNTKEYSVPELDEVWAEHADLGVNMMEAYIAKYGKDEEWEVLVTEFPFQTIVQHPARKTPWFWYVGILDGVWMNRSTKRKVIPDHKTTRAIQLNYLRMDDQATAYWTFGVDALYNARLLQPGEKLDGMLFNFLRKAKRDPRPTDADGYYLNKDGSVSKKQPVPLHARVPVYREWYEREGAKLRALVEFEDMERIGRDGKRMRGIAPPPTAYKNPGQFTCPGCWLFDICELHEIGQDWLELKRMTTTDWQPYAPHEIREAR